MLKQYTIKSLIRTVGIGLHSGRKVMLTLHLATAGTGIAFTRADLDPVIEIPATVSAISDTHLASVPQEGGAYVSTVKYLMSTCAGLGIDNLYVDVGVEETPTMDDSAASFVFLLQSADIEEQGAAKRSIRATKPVEIREGNRLVHLDSYFGFKLSLTVEFRHPTVDKTGQTFEIGFADTSYTREIARVRTFDSVREVEMLCEVGLARGGSPDNAIVLDEHRTLSDDKLRYSDEFVRRKILDAIGDLYVVSHPLVAAYIAHKSSRGLDNALLRALLTDEAAYEMVTFDKVEEVSRAFLSQWQPAFS